MYTYEIVIRNGEQTKTITVRCSNGQSAMSEALEFAGQTSKDKGSVWGVSRCDSV